MSEKQQIEVETKVRDSVKQRRFWRLVLQDRKCRSRLAAVPVDPNALLPDMALNINELLSQNRPSLLSPTLLRPRVHIVTLAEPSCRRFAVLSRRDDIKAFNTDAYEAIFDHETYDQNLSRALGIHNGPA